MNDRPDDIGPIDYLVVEFPGNRMTGEGLPMGTTGPDAVPAAGARRGGRGHHEAEPAQ
jgi:hypothetical protein